MQREIAIRVEGLGKRYRIGSLPAYKSVRESFSQALRLGVRRFSRSEAAADGEFIQALKGVSLSVSQGEVVGIIGHNGAGKSTLLKILSRITEPTDGYAEIHGRVGSLLEVGTGFHPELTGRENIHLNGAILGMKQAEIGRKFDEIVAFSGVGKFMDTPMKRYSTGMYVRLAFAVAAHLDPEILLVDEVLAVGDAAFQERCLGKMSEVASGGRTVLFVSHNMAAVRRLCSRVIVLDGGQIQADESPELAIQKYLRDIGYSIQSGTTVFTGQPRRSGSGSVRIVNFTAQGCDRNGSTPSTGADAEFLIQYAASENRRLLRLHVTMGVTDGLGNRVFACATSMTPVREFRDLPPTGTIICRITRLPLIPGEYSVNLMLKDDVGVADIVDGLNFVVRDTGDSGFMAIPSGKWGTVVVPHEWDWVSLADASELNMSDTA